jgi:gas vesicle protein
MGEDRNANASGVIVAFLLGGLAGAALAMLYAPRSGKETRDILGDKLREGAERGRELRDRAVAKSREMYDDASEFVDKQRETIDKRKERLAAAIEAGRQAFREEKDQDKEKM